MNDPILFTPQDIINAILAICGAITAVAAATAVIVKIVASIKRPNQIQDQKIAQLEKDVEEIRDEMKENKEKAEDRFENTKKHIKAAEEANAVTQRALLALLSHAINGNDIDNLRKAKTDLESYLTRRPNEERG